MTGNSVVSDTRAGNGNSFTEVTAKIQVSIYKVGVGTVHTSTEYTVGGYVRKSGLGTENVPFIFNVYSIADTVNLDKGDYRVYVYRYIATVPPLYDGTYKGYLLNSKLNIMLIRR